jgi:membrane-bound serine protease (ClpP class)
MRVLRAVAALAALAGILSLSASAADAPQPRVLAIQFDNDVNPVTADYVTGAIDRAVDQHYDAAVILLDTPGGLSTAMKDIYQKELNAPIPVIVYVSPAGARAASAGVWIGQAADILAMAPQTNIGSSTPISTGGGNIPSDLRRKVVNDAAASLRGLAAAHGRNAAWADSAVRKASNLTAQEALARNVIDVVAPSLPALLNQIDGQTTKGDKHLVLHTAGAHVDNVHMSLWDRVLDTLIDPNIITILLSLGVLAITVEIFHPGLIFPAAFGVISLVMAFFGLQVLPFSWAGILLLAAAFVFWILELFLPSHGALTAAGATSFVFGALLLFRPAGEQYKTSLWVALGFATVLALMFGFAFAKALAARRKPPRTGAEELAGAVGVVREPLDPEGYVFVHGEIWRARATSGEELPAGTAVKVDRLAEGLLLEVSRAEKHAAVGQS